MMEPSQEVIKCLKACVLSRKGGVPFHELGADYKELVGSDVPFKDLGFTNLLELLYSVDGFLVDVQKGVVRTAPNENTRHLHQLINKQKDNKPKKPFKKHGTKKPYPSSKSEYQQKWPTKPKCSAQSQYPPLSRSPPPSYRSWSPPSYRSQSPPPYRSRNRSPRRRVPLRERVPPEYFYTAPHHRRTPYQPYHKYDTNNNYGSSQDFDEFYEDMWENQWEDSHSVRYSRYSAIKAKKSDSQRTVGKRTTIQGYEVIGDELMVDMLGTSSATCRAGMTVKRALLEVRKHGCSDKVLIALGTVDILKGCTDTELMLDMNQLIQEACNTGAEVVVCNLAPMPSLRREHRTIRAVNDYNHWLCYGGHSAHHVIDLNTLFKRGRYVNYSLFQEMSKKQPPQDYWWEAVPWTRTASALAEKKIAERLRRLHSR